MRPVLDESCIHPAIRERVGTLHADVLREAGDAIAQHDVVVLGMAGNPFVGKARRLLDGRGIAHRDIDYGGYLSQWRRRNALKMWTGWPTFPMVFVKGSLIGGFEDLAQLAESGELQRLLG